MMSTCQPHLISESVQAADPNAPPPRSNHTTSLHENSVVLFGGHGGVGYQRKPFNDTWVLNLDNQRLSFSFFKPMYLSVFNNFKFSFFTVSL